MKYKIIQNTESGQVYIQEITSFYKMYLIVLNLVSLDYSYIKEVKVEGDKVTIQVLQGEGYYIPSFKGLRQLFSIHVDEMIKLKRKQIDQQYESYQKNSEEYHQFDKEFIKQIKKELDNLC